MLGSLLATVFRAELAVGSELGNVVKDTTGDTSDFSERRYHHTSRGFPRSLSLLRGLTL